jgi:hypothetical protein
MTLNMDDDLDMSMRAPYISMSESSELPMLIAEDLMWGAQPDLKQTLNVNKKLELNLNNQTDAVDSRTQQKSTMESSLASLLCSQLLQHQQQINEQQKQITLTPEVKIRILDSSTVGNAFTSQQETRMGACRRTLSKDAHFNDEFSEFLANDTIEWTMNDLLQLKKQPAMLKINHEDDSAIIQAESQQQIAESIVKCREKSTTSHKRPSIAYEISSSKRAKGHETIKPQNLMATNSQKKFAKPEQSTSNDTRWSPVQSPQKPQPASNSVLMNLLVSGCDVSAGYYTCLPRPKVAKA